MRRRNLLIGSAIAALLTAMPAAAENVAPQTTRAEAEAEVQRRRAALQDAERTLERTREAEARQIDEESDNRRLEEARVRLGLEGGAVRTRASADDREDARRDLRAEAVAKADDEFAGIRFGVGVSYTVGSRRRVSSAQVVNGIVRVTDEDNGRARMVLEAHAFIYPRRPDDTDTRRWGIGPFVAFQPGEGNLINAIGAGVMIGLRPDPTKAQSLNFGVGVIVDPNTRLLGGGIVADQPLPAGETEIRYRETAQVGLLLMSSFAF
jgi:hypothetical protein